MAISNAMNTTTLANTIPAVLRAEVIRSAANARVFRPLITEVPFTGPGDTLDLLQVGTLSASEYPGSGGSETDARTYSADTPSKKTITPYEVDVAMAFSDKALRRTAVDVLTVYAQELGRAVAVKMDSDVASEYANFTGTSVDEGDTAASIAKLLQAIATVKVAAKDQSGEIFAVLHTSAWDDLLTDTSNSIVSADVRGDSNAMFTGSITLVGGASVHFTTAINSAGSTSKYQNMVFTRRTIALGWKSDLFLESWDDRDTKSLKMAAGADYDVVTRVPGEGVVYTVTV